MSWPQSPRPIRRSVEAAANILAAALVVGAGVLLLQARHQRPPITHNQHAGEVWDVSNLPIDFGKARRTLVIGITRGCPFCAKSLPFYRELLRMRDRSAEKIQIVVAVSEREKEIDRYLASEGIQPDAILRLARSRLSIRVVPALAIAASDGATIATFTGALAPAEENAVKSRLFGLQP